MHYSVINPYDVVNGEGIRVSLFVSGCSFNCDGCFNKQAQNYKFGERYDIMTECKILDLLKPDEIKGLSLLGGEPLALPNRETIYLLCNHVKKYRPNKDIWLWSGYTLGEIKREFPKILDVIDVLIDGKFEKKNATHLIPWRGSGNQKLYRAPFK